MNDFQHFVGTRAATQAFDLEAFGVWARQHLEGFAGPLQVEQFKGGQSNPTFKLITPRRTYVMRSKPGPAAKLLPSAHAIEREYAVMRALADSDVPVPRMLALCQDESVIGRAFYIMEHVQGRVLWDPALPDCNPTERTAIYDEMNRVIAALHSVEYVKRGLTEYGKPGNYFERQIGRWSKQYQASADGSGDLSQPIAAMERLMQWLPEHIPNMARADMVSVVHGDYRLDNLIFHQTEPRVLAVLDWELSTLGHPLADFSYHCMTWHIQPGAFRGLGGVDLAALGIPDEDTYINRYCARTHYVTPEALRCDWNFYLAYNLFRLAAILQGIAKRVEAGTASSAQARASAAGARPLAELAWRFAQAQGA